MNTSSQFRKVLFGRWWLMLALSGFLLSGPIACWDHDRDHDRDRDRDHAHWDHDHDYDHDRY